MREDFKRSGLAHVLAVSGQNVTLLALLAWPLLARAGLGRRGRLAGTLALIALYVPLTGAGPSIVRAGAMGAAGDRGGARRPAGLALVRAAARRGGDARARPARVAGRRLAAELRGGRRASSLLHRPMQALARAPARAARRGCRAHGRGDPRDRTADVVPLRPGLAGVAARQPRRPAGDRAGDVDRDAERGGGSGIACAGAPAERAGGYPLAYVASVARGLRRPAGSGLGAGAGLGRGAGRRIWGGRGGLPAPSAQPEGRPTDGGTRPGLRPLAIVVALGVTGSLVLMFWRSSGSSRPSGPFHRHLPRRRPGRRDTVPGAGRPCRAGRRRAAGNRLVAQLRSLDVRALDAVVLTHAQHDHQGGLEEVLAGCPSRLLLDGGGGSPGALHARIVAEARRQGTRVLEPRAGQRLRLGGLRLRVLSPPRAAVRAPRPQPRTRTCARSSCSPPTAASTCSCRPTPRATSPARCRWHRSEVLKVAHHGSDDEGLPALLERLRPRAAVIEVGAANPYGHPSPGTLRALGKAHIATYRTDRNGDVRADARAPRSRDHHRAPVTSPPVVAPLHSRAWPTSSPPTSSTATTT